MNQDITYTARVFAISAHEAIGQTRKYTGEPYWRHCEDVANRVGSVSEDKEMIAAAWLHDVVEDTNVTSSTIMDFFGYRVASMVEKLTDTETGNRKERKMKALIRLAGSSADVQTIKMSDIISNTSSIVDHDPKFAVVYMAEKFDLVNALTRADERLRNIAIEQINSYYGKC